MAREMPVDLVDRIGAAADAYDKAAESDAAVTQRADEAAAANSALVDARGAAATDRKAATDAGAQATKALADWLAGTKPAEQAPSAATSRR